MVEVNIGAAANDGTGDPLRTAFAKVNADINSVKTEIVDIQSNLANIESLDSLEAIAAAEQTSVAAAEQADASAAIVEAALAGRSNAVFSIGDSEDGLTHEVVVAERALVSENTAMPYPTVDIELETGVVRSLMQAGAVTVITEARDEALTSAAQAAMYDGIRLDTVAGLLSDTALTYTIDTPSTVASGDFIATKAEGFRYQVAASSATNHHLVTAGGVKLYVLAGSGPVNAKAFGAKGDGVADDYPAISAALANFGQVYVPGGRYRVSQCIAVWNKVLIGENAFDGSATRMTTIIGLASIPIYDPVIAPARSGAVHNLRIQYDTGVITGTETEGQRRGIGPKEGLPSMQRGACVSCIWLTDVGTGIGNITGADSSNGIFSASFNDIEIVRHSYAAIDLKGAGTGNVFGSIYIADATDHMGPLRPLYGVRLRDNNNDFWAQLNIEHMSYSEAALDIHDARNIAFGTLHIEGVDTRGEGQRFIRINGSMVNITNCAIIHTGMSFDDTAVFELGDAECFQLREGVGSPWSYKSIQSTLSIQSLQLRGLSNPNTSNYDSARRGLENISGFKLFRRTAGYEDKNFRVYIKSVLSAAYTSTFEWLIYRLIDTQQYSDVNRLDIAQFSRRGNQVEPGENFVRNGAFDTFDNPNATASSSTDIACATHWTIESGTGALRATQESEGYGEDAVSFIRLSNLGTVGINQRFQTIIPEFREYVGREMVLSFEGRANILGQVLGQISGSVIWTGGTPAGGVYKQIIGGTGQSVRFDTEWKTFRIPFTGLLPESFTTPGTSPYWRLRFEINGGAATIEAVIDLRNIKVEVGTEASSFTRRVRP